MVSRVVRWFRDNHKAIALGVGGVGGVLCPLLGATAGPCAIVSQALQALIGAGGG